MQSFTFRPDRPISINVKQWLRTGYASARPGSGVGESFYRWRTAGDEKVRLGHAAREGLIFPWSSPPPGGHPGKDFGCRCHAERLVDASVGRMVIKLRISNNKRMGGGGKGVILRQIGNLRDIISGYRIQAAVPLGRQISTEAQKVPGQEFVYEFFNTYNL